jgi:uncharacterized protein YwgA
MERMRTERTPEEQLTDSALALALLARVSDNTLGDRLKVMKLLFLADYEMFSERAKGLNFVFYRHKLGPFSKEVEEAWELLKRSGHLQEEEEFALTSEGRALAEAILEDVLSLPENRPFLTIIARVVGQFAEMSRQQIMRFVYAMNVVDVDGREYGHIREVPLGIRFTGILETSEARVAITMGPEWLDTLNIAFDPAKRESLAHAIRQVRAGRAVPHEHVWPAV